MNFIEAKKESSAIVKDEVNRCRMELNEIIDKQKDNLEKIANRHTERISAHFKKLESYEVPKRVFETTDLSVKRFVLFLMS